MITKFKKYNESIKSLLVGPTKEEVWTDLMNGKLKGFLRYVPETPEDFFNQMKEGCEIMLTNSNGNYFGKNDNFLFIEEINNEYKYKVIHISYVYIWSIFENVYEFGYDKITPIIENGLKDTKWEGFEIMWFNGVK